jgi:hypothetical protein
VTAERDTAERLARIEGALVQVLRELRGRRRRAGKRTRTVIERASQAAANDTEYAPTDLDIAAAKRALRRHR